MEFYVMNERMQRWIEDIVRRCIHAFMNHTIPHLMSIEIYSSETSLSYHIRFCFDSDQYIYLVSYDEWLALGVFGNPANYVRVFVDTWWRSIELIRIEQEVDVHRRNYERAVQRNYPFHEITRLADIYWTERRRINEHSRQFVPTDFTPMHQYGFDVCCDPNAKVRAMEFLLEKLSEEQRESFKKKGYFTVIGGQTGTEYRVHNGRVMNVSDGNNDYCFLPQGYVPLGDVLLAQKLHLESSGERHALRLANKKRSR